MPIRNTLALTLTLAGAVACGGYLVQAHAQGRDLVPTPASPGWPGKGQRPQVLLRPSASVIPFGAPITFKVRSSVNGYAHLYVMSASGRAQVWLENMPIPAGEHLEFPAGELVIRAAPPAGREDVMLIVTRERINGFFGYKTTNSPRVLPFGQQNFKRVLTEKFNDMPHRQWNYARTAVQVVAGPNAGWKWDPESESTYWDGQWDNDDDND
jgi:hypothetical protein